MCSVWWIWTTLLVHTMQSTFAISHHPTSYRNTFTCPCINKSSREHREYGALHRSPLFVSGNLPVVVRGGVLMCFAGCGLDICTYSVLILLFRVSEKVATPTAVTLMGVSSVFSSYWRTFVMYETSRDALLYVVGCIPIVVIGAPFGFLVGSHFHRY